MAMDNEQKLKEQVKALTDELRVEKLLTVQKDEQIQAAKQEVGSAGAKVVQVYLLIDEYNGALFSWCFKGFELLRRYLAKHNPGIDLEGLDFEEVDKEIEVDEAVSAIGNFPNVEGGAPDLAVGDDAPAS